MLFSNSHIHPPARHYPAFHASKPEIRIILARHFSPNGGFCWKTLRSICFKSFLGDVGVWIGCIPAIEAHGKAFQLFSADIVHFKFRDSCILTHYSHGSKLQYHHNTRNNQACGMFGARCRGYGLLHKLKLRSQPDLTVFSS
jgi:hypothetical protein